MASLTFYVSHVEVSVDCDLPEVERTLRAVWAGCSHPLRPTRRQERFELSESGGRVVIARHGGERVVAADTADAAPLFEGLLYRAILDWHEGLVVLHAALVARAEGSLLLLGASNAGKSSLALAAVRAGFSYFSDEIVLFDGTVLWGVPRAIQFDAGPLAGAVPEWIADADRASYLLRLPDGSRGVIPLVSLPQEARATAAVPAATALIVRPMRGPRDELSACPLLEALAAVHEAAHRPPALNMGALVGPERAFRLEWSAPRRAIELLGAQFASWL